MGQFENMKINTGKKGNNFKELIEYLIVIARSCEARSKAISCTFTFTSIAGDCFARLALTK